MGEKTTNESPSRLPRFLQNPTGETAFGAAVGALAGFAWGESAKIIAEDVTHYPEHLHNFPVVAGPVVGALAVGLAFRKAGNRHRQIN
jgi:hypothetical protein